MAWRELRKTWHDTTVDYCDVCGNLLIHACWEFRGEQDVALRACREDDERLYHLLRSYRSRIEAARQGQVR